MGSKTGYVSSFDEGEGFGFIRPADQPKRLVKFRHDALEPDAVTDIRPGLEVTFEIGPDAESERWPLAKSVKVERQPVDEVDPATSEADAL